MSINTSSLFPGTVLYSPPRLLIASFQVGGSLVQE